MNIEEIKARVDKALASFNQEGFSQSYDFRPTHANAESKKLLEEASYNLSEGKINEEQLKLAIKAYRDTCPACYIDFHILALEPGQLEMERIKKLFYGSEDFPATILTPVDDSSRRAQVEAKILGVMKLTMEAKQVVSEKLRQQFSWLVVRTKEKSPAMLATSMNFESYNPYQKTLTPALPVSFVRDSEVSAPKELEGSPSVFSSTLGDNSDFESRLPQAPTKKKRPSKPSGPRREIEQAADVWLSEGAKEAAPPHELPNEIHEEFAAYCRAITPGADGAL